MMGSYTAMYNDYHEVKVHVRDDGKKWVTLCIGDKDSGRHRDVDLSIPQFEALIQLMQEASEVFPPRKKREAKE